MSVKYEVLDSDKDLVKWKKTLSLLSDELQDIYFYPEYVGMYKFIKGTKSLLFTFKEEENIWLHPFLLHPIDSGAFFSLAAPSGLTLNQLTDMAVHYQIRKIKTFSTMPMSNLANGA